MAQKIGRYEIERAIPGGGMADVYLARDPNTERQVVVKVIKREYSGDDEFRARFWREARTITKLEHPAIVPVYDFDEHEGQSFIVMRYMPGGALADRMAAGPLSLPEVARIVERIASALDYAHNRGIVHRDLKPGNVLFDDGGNAYLADFGIAKLAEATTKLTGTGIIGTPAYMSPEQARAAQNLDRRSDVYSLGVMVFELLTGELPFKSKEAMGMALAHITEPVPDIRKTRPDLPRESDSLIHRAMAKQPDDRYPTTGDLARDLSLIATKPSKGRAPAVGAIRESPLRESPLRGTPPPKPPTPPPKPGDAATRPEGDSRPTGVIVEAERPTRSQRPRRSDLPVWLLPAALFIVLCLAASIGGAFALPALLGRGDSRIAPTDTAAVALATTAASATRAPTKTPALPTHTPTLAHTPTLSPGATQVSEQDGMVMVYVPAGPFEMGSNEGDSEEQPVHTVTLDAFWIDQTEVTNRMYALCVDAGVCQPLGSTGSSTRSSYFGNPQFVEYPVINVSWNDATAYCEWAGRRLPTEAEWEKAARGDDGRIYPWGDEISCSLTNYWGKDGGCVGDTTQVGSYPDGASPFGALDMAGNVWEWVNDWYDENYYDNSPSENPQGPSSGQYRVLRGGSWNYYVWLVRAAFRNGYEPTNGNSDIGFRCSRSP